MLNLFNLIRVKKALRAIKDKLLRTSYLFAITPTEQTRSHPKTEEECYAGPWLKSKAFSGGLQILQPKNPFEEEKGEGVRERVYCGQPVLLARFSFGVVLYVVL